MPEGFSTQLRVPADRRFLPLVQAHVRSLVRMAGFEDQDVLSLELAAEEAFQNICLHAYPDGTPGDVLLAADMGHGEMRLSFQDEGLPFDPALLDREQNAPASEVPGLGLKLIHNAVDEVRWVNLGRQGKALLLVRQLPDHDTEARAKAQDGLEERARIPRAPEQPYDIRPFRPDEALQVARLFWLTYGYSYKNESFYRPEGLLDLVERDKLVSFVAVTRDGEVVGHAGLIRPEPVPMAEMGLLVVSPAHRGRYLMERFTDVLTAKAVDMGLFGVSFNPVTSHFISQRQAMAVGGKACGMELAACPPRTFKAMQGTDGIIQRESYLHCFRYLGDPPPAKIHVPQRHQAMIRDIYANLGRPLVAGTKAGQSGPGKYAVSYDRGLSKGTIRVARAHERQWPEIERAASDLLDIAGAEVVHMDLPLAQPATAALCERAEDAGFAFTGVMPHAAEDGDMLRLTRLASPFDLGKLKLYSDFVHDLARYIEQELARAGRSTS